MLRLINPINYQKWPVLKVTRLTFIINIRVKENVTSKKLKNATLKKKTQWPELRSMHTQGYLRHCWTYHHSVQGILQGKT